MSDKVALSNDRALSEAALHESEERFRVLFEQCPDAVLLLEAEPPWRIVDCNPAACEMNGYSREELIGMPIAQVDPTAGNPQVSREKVEVLRRGGNLKDDGFHRRKNGTLFPIEYTTSLVNLGGRELILGIDLDVTERQRAYEHLAESERRFATLLSNTPALVYRCSNEPDWPMEFLSDYAEELTGYPVQDLVTGGISFADLILEEERERVWNAVQAAVARRETFRLEYPIRRKDGAVRHVEEHGQAVYDEDGRVLALEGLISDVTERKRAEERTTAFSILGKRLSAAATAAAAARIIATVADDLLGWDAFALLLYSAEDDLLYPTLDFDLVDGQRTESPPGGPAVPPGPVSRRAIAEGPQLLLPERPSAVLEGLQPFGDTSRPSASLMFVPVRGTGSVIGVLSIQSYTARAYNEVDLGTLQALADHCGGALERIRAEEALRTSEERFRLLFEHSPDGVLLIDPHDPEVPWRIIDCNEAACRMNGYSREELRGQPLNVLHPEAIDSQGFAEQIERLRIGSDKYDLEHRRKDGSVFPIESLSTLITVAGREMVLGIDRDITERKLLEEQLRHQAFHDVLTGLPNRALFLDRLEHALARAGRRHESVAVLYLDLDRFKLVNDSLGHDAGDEVFRQVAGRLRECVRPEDTAARLGGDEFAVLLEDIEGQSDAESLAGRILERLRPACEVGGREVAITTSIGIAIGGAGQEGPEDLLRSADAAMYRAKRTGKARYEVYDPAMGSQATERVQLEVDLRRALDRDEFQLYYQPVVELHSGKIVGAEALLRWEHPQRGLIPATEFVPIAEETGLILPIGRWILRQACEQSKEWQGQGGDGNSFVVSINLSARHFQHPELVQEVSRALAETDLHGRGLMIEITESAVMEDAEANAATLRELKKLGVRLAIDDFGTGYSSLAYLHRFPVDVLKIDRSFVSGVGRASEETAIVRAVVGLTHSLQLQVVAEGVETDEQVRRLLALGCRLGQGYYYSRPVSKEEMGSLLAEGGRLTGRARV